MVSSASRGCGLALGLRQLERRGLGGEIGGTESVGSAKRQEAESER